jgi:hypothetical protein
VQNKDERKLATGTQATPLWSILENGNTPQALAPSDECGGAGLVMVLIAGSRTEIIHPELESQNHKPRHRPHKTTSETNQAQAGRKC